MIPTLYRGTILGSLLQAAILISPENGMMRWARCGIEKGHIPIGDTSSLQDPSAETANCVMDSVEEIYVDIPILKLMNHRVVDT